MHWNLSDNLKLVFYLQQFSNFEIRFWLAFFPVPIEFRTFFPVIYFNRKTVLYWCYVNWRFSDSISSEWMVAVSVFSSLFLQLKNCLFVVVVNLQIPINNKYLRESNFTSLWTTNTVINEIPNQKCCKYWHVKFKAQLSQLCLSSSTSFMWLEWPLIR